MSGRPTFKMREFGLLTPSKRSKRCRVSHVAAEAAVGKSDHWSVIIHVAESDTIPKKKNPQILKLLINPNE